jgi:hypothetical protein
LDVTELESNVTASQDSIPEFGIVSDVKVDTEDQPINLLANQLLHVPDQINTLVFIILKTVVNVLNAQMVQDTLLELTEPAVIDQERSVTASQDSIPEFGTVLDAKTVPLDQVTEALVLPLPHVVDQDNTMEFMTPKTVEDVLLAQISQVTSSELIELDVIESESNAIASQDSMNNHGTVLDVDSEAEDQPIKELASQFNHVLDHSNITVSGILKAAVHADSAHKVQDTSSEPTDQDVIDQERFVIASQDSMSEFGTV